MAKEKAEASSAQDQLQDYLRQERPYALHPDLDFAAIVFHVLQSFINLTQRMIREEEVLKLLTTIQQLRVKDPTSLEEVEGTLRDCVLNFLEKITPALPPGIPIEMHELKCAKDGVMRLFPLGHKFEDEE